MTQEPIRIGIAGLGRAGWSMHALGIEGHPAFQLVAVTDTEAGRLREASERFGCRTYATFEEMVRDADVELVVVATPNHLHAPMSCAALSAGKHVLVDKPMALNGVEADEMLAYARARDKVLTVFQIMRLDPDFIKIQEVLRSGVLGPIQEIHLAVHTYDRRRDWQTLKKFGAGELNNTGSHLLDQALVLAGGEWRQLFSAMRHVAYVGDAEDHVKVVFLGRDDVIIDVEIGVSPLDLPRWLIMGKYGSLRGDRERLEWKYYHPAAVPEAVASEGAAPERRYGSGESLPWITERAEMVFGNSTRQFYDRLYASLREGAPLLVPPEQSRNLVALQDACRSIGPHPRPLPQ